MASTRQDLGLALAGQQLIFLTTLVIVLLIMLTAVPSQADEITFLDSTETLSFSTSSPRITGIFNSCGNVPGMEVCTVAIFAPSGSTFLDDTVGVEPIGEADGTISDFTVVNPVGGGSAALVTFGSDLPGHTFGSCTVFGAGGCPITEDGMVQIAGIIEWADAAGNITVTDTVKFQSDVEPVPEPTSLVLLGGGLLAVVGYVKKRRA